MYHKGFDSNAGHIAQAMVGSYTVVLMYRPEGDYLVEVSGPSFTIPVAHNGTDRDILGGRIAEDFDEARRLYFSLQVEVINMVTKINNMMVEKEEV